ncbi:unnamed protein product [Camellia sinensis]
MKSNHDSKKINSNLSDVTRSNYEFDGFLLSHSRSRHRSRSVHGYHLSHSFRSLQRSIGTSQALRGATTLKARLECKNKLNGSTPILQIEENNDFEFDFENCRSILAKGSGLHIETLDGEKWGC